MVALKRIVALLLVLTMAAGVAACGEKVDPNAIAKVVTGDSTRYVQSVEEMTEAMDLKGNTVITLLKDISSQDALSLPYSCTIDFNGHTFASNPERGVGIIVNKAGTENPVLTLKNGTLDSYADAVRVKEGALVLSDMQLFTEFGNCIGLYDTNEAYKDKNKIENCTLVSDTYGCLCYNGSEADFSKTGITITNTKLIAANPEGESVFNKEGTTTVSGRIVLGEGAQLYSYADIIAYKEMLFEGSGMAKTTGVEVTAGDQTYTGIHQWTEDTENKVLDVLMLGNSFCYYFTPELHGMAATVGIQLNLQNLYYGGRSIKAHAERLESGEADYEQFWTTNDLNRFKDPAKLSIQAALANEKWDVITAQQHFDVERTVDYDTAWASCSPYAKNLFDHLKANYPEAKLYWHETWAYGVGYPIKENGKMPVDSVAVQTRQQTQIREVSKALCAESKVDMIPSGDAWEIARNNPAIGDTLNKDDRCHDGDIGGGQYLNACVWFEVLTGKSCIGNTYRPDDYKLDEAKVAHLQNAAHEAVAAIYGADYAK